MFEDIVGAKFEGVDIGSRDVISEMKAMLMKGFDMGIDELDAAEDEEFMEVWAEFVDTNLDTIAQMYVDEFSSDEIIELLNFEMTPLAEKKLRFHMRMQKFVHDSFFDMMMKKDDFVDCVQPKNDFIKALQEFNWEEEEEGKDSVVWDSKEERKE